MLYSLIAFISPWKYRRQRYSSNAARRGFFVNVRDVSTAAKALCCACALKRDCTSLAEAIAQKYTTNTATQKRRWAYVKSVKRTSRTSKRELRLTFPSTRESQGLTSVT